MSLQIPVLRRWIAPALLVLLALPISAQVRTLTMPEMVSAAGMIFVGTVVDVHGGIDSEGEIVTYTTFQVEQPVLGVSGLTVTVKQLGGEANGLSTWIMHMRYFRRGEHVLVMFYPASQLGFTSPVGLGQAVWSVSADGSVQIPAATLQSTGALARKYGVDPTGARPASRAAVINLIKGLKKGGNAR